jgi:hypothetical protein
MTKPSSLDQLTPDDFEDDQDDVDLDGGDYDDCGLGPDGQCSKAGTEECDWICGALR